jgi:competence protein ComGC
MCNSRMVNMEELSNKLVITLLVLIIVSTIISTIAFLNLEPTVVVNDVGEQTGSAKASIQIVNELPKPDMDTSSAKASIEIVESDG